MPVTQSECEVAKYCDLQIKKSEVNSLASIRRIAKSSDYQVYALVYMSQQNVASSVNYQLTWPPCHVSSETKSEDNYSSE